MEPQVVEEVSQQLPIKTKHLETVLNGMPLQGFDSSCGQAVKLGKTEPFTAVEQGIISRCSEVDMPLAQVNKGLISSLQAVMNTGQGRGTIQEVAVSDLPALAGVALDEFRGESRMDSTVMRTVFGGSKNYPLRALSYVVPSLRYAQEMQNSGMQVPHIQYITMPHVGASVNGGETAKMKYQSDVLHYVGTQFVQRYFPDVAQYVQFSDDEAFIQDEQVQILHELLKRHKDDIFNEEMRDQFSRLDENTFNYAAYHPLVHDWSYLSRPFGEHYNSDVVINIGGKAEKQFDRFRRNAKSILAQAAYYGDIEMPETVQMFTDHKVPPYMNLNGPDSGLDISLAEALYDSSRINIFKGINRKDYNLLCRDVETITSVTGSLEEFADFMESC